MTHVFQLVYTLDFYSTVTEFRQRPENDIFQKKRSRLKCAIMKLPQEVRQHYDREKHKEVNAEKRPATAIQPVSQRPLSPQDSTPDKRKSVSVYHHNYHLLKKKC